MRDIITEIRTLVRLAPLKPFGLILSYDDYNLLKMSTLHSGSFYRPHGSDYEEFESLRILKTTDKTDPRLVI